MFLEATLVFMLRDSFGGYCDNRKAHDSAFADGPTRNPWRDGGCVPQAPRELAFGADGTDLVLTCRRRPATADPRSAPAGDGGSPVEGYTVQWKSGSQDFDASRQAVVTDLGALTYALGPGSESAGYQVQVSAFNTNGAGAVATASAEATGTPLRGSSEVRLAVDPPRVPEGTAGGAALAVTGTLDAGARSSITVVGVTVSAGTAAAGDFTAVAPFDLTIAAGVTAATATFTLTPVNDAVDEADETLVVAGTADSADLTVVAAQVTIADDDQRGLAVTPDALAVEEGGDATYLVALTSQPTGPVTVDVTVSGYDGAMVSPAALAFTADDWAAARTVTARVAADADRADAVATVAHAARGADYGADAVPPVTVTVRIEDNNQGPTVRSAARSEVAENVAAVGTVAAVDADLGDAVNGYTLAGGADAERFAVDAAGALTFIAAPDFESPWDAVSTAPANPPGNNEYVVVVAATSGAGRRALTVMQAIVVSVTNVDEDPTGVPMVTGNLRVGETLTAGVGGIADPDGLAARAGAPGYGFQWQRLHGADQRDIPNATAQTYTVAAADIGRALRVRVSFTDDGGWRESVVSAPTAVVSDALTGGICDRDAGVVAAILGRLATVDSCAQVTAQQLAAIDSLVLTDHGAEVAVESLTRADLAGLHNLESLWISKVSVSGLPADLLADTGRLQELALESLELEALPAGLFSGLTDLAVLVLGDNGLEQQLNGARVRSASGLDAALGHQAASRVGAPDPERLTARFASLPATHDGTSAFLFRLRFSEAVAISDVAMRDDVFSVTGGSITSAARVPSPSTVAWDVTVQPAAAGDVVIALRGGRACSEPGAVCTSGGTMLSSRQARVVPGPDLSLSVAGVRALEGSGASLMFPVTLNRVAGATVTVAYATEDGTATAGADYEAAAGILTFTPGATARTVAVTVHDDTHDEGDETLTLRLSGARGARIADATAIGTIANHDPLPQVWLARFGRTVAGHVLDAVAGRMNGVPPSQAIIAGRRLRATDPTLRDRAAMERHWAARLQRGQFADRPRTMELRGLLAASSFDLATAGGVAGEVHQRSGGRWGLWGRGAWSRFAGEQAGLTMGGDVVSGIAGADFEQEQVLAGIALAYSSGGGSFDHASGDAGELRGWLLSVHPYLRLRLHERLAVWGLLGYGRGGEPRLGAAAGRARRPRHAAGGGSGRWLRAHREGRRPAAAHQLRRGARTGGEPRRGAALAAAAGGGLPQHPPVRRRAEPGAARRTLLGCRHRRRTAAVGGAGRHPPGARRRPARRPPPDRRGAQLRGSVAWRAGRVHPVRGAGPVGLRAGSVAGRCSAGHRFRRQREPERQPPGAGRRRSRGHADAQRGHALLAAR